MEIIEKLNHNGPLLLVCAENEKNNFKQLVEAFASSKVINTEDTVTEQDGSAVTVLSAIQEDRYTPETILELLRLLSPGGTLVLIKISNVNQLKFELTTKGFMNVAICNDSLTAKKPTFEAGSSAKLNLQRQPVSAVWKLNDTLDNDVETIDPDNLLDEDDLKKPDPSSLRVCGTTGKRKACKDCVCGLADELAAEVKEGKVIDTKDTAKSSCGSCYLGDAFRCATCPYLGMPAFKPGEKIQLSGSQLQDDV